MCCGLVSQKKIKPYLINVISETFKFRTIEQYCVNHFSNSKFFCKMLKPVIILMMVIVCCYCLEGNDLSVFDSRAKKKKNSLKMLGKLLLTCKLLLAESISCFS